MKPGQMIKIVGVLGNRKYYLLKIEDKLYFYHKPDGTVKEASVPLAALFSKWGYEKIEPISGKWAEIDRLAGEADDAYEADFQD